MRSKIKIWLGKPLKCNEFDGHEVTESSSFSVMIKIDYSENQFFPVLSLTINLVHMLFRRTFWKIQIYEFLQTSAGA